MEQSQRCERKRMSQRGGRWPKAWVGSRNILEGDPCFRTRHPNSWLPVCLRLFFATSALYPGSVSPPQPRCKLQDTQAACPLPLTWGPSRVQLVLAQVWVPCPSESALSPTLHLGLASPTHCGLCRPLISFLINHCWSPAMSFPLQLIA